MYSYRFSLSTTIPDLFNAETCKKLDYQYHMHLKLTNNQKFVDSRLYDYETRHTIYLRHIGNTDYTDRAKVLYIQVEEKPIFYFKIMDQWYKVDFHKRKPKPSLTALIMKMSFHHEMQRYYIRDDFINYLKSSYYPICQAKNSKQYKELLFHIEQGFTHFKPCDRKIGFIKRFDKNKYFSAFLYNPNSGEKIKTYIPQISDGHFHGKSYQKLKKEQSFSHLADIKEDLKPPMPPCPIKMYIPPIPPKPWDFHLKGTGLTKKNSIKTKENITGEQEFCFFCRQPLNQDEVYFEPICSSCKKEFYDTVKTSAN